MSFVFSTFWSGNTNLRQNVCLNSFIKNNHRFELYKYDTLYNLPKGVIIKDASEIIPREEYEEYKSKFPKNWGVFSDKFRYLLLLKKGGWWVDADIVCLRSLIDIRDDQSFMCFEDKEYINNACLKFKKGDEIMKYCVEYIEKWEKDNNYDYGKVWWGQFGPALLTEAIKKFNRIDEVYNSKFAYPCPYVDTLDLLNPSKCERLKMLSKDSYFCHLWNEILSREKIPKSFLGKRGSYWNDLVNLYSVGNFSSRLLKVKLKSGIDYLIYIFYSIPSLKFLKLKKLIKKKLIN